MVTENIFTAHAPYTPRELTAHPGRTVNVTCIALQEELIFIDCGVLREVVVQFRKHMEKHFHRKTTHLLLTHSHWDHILAMDVFQDAQIVVSRKAFDRSNPFS